MKMPGIMSSRISNKMSNVSNKVMNLCIPALIYLVLAVVQLISSFVYKLTDMTVLGTSASVIFIIVWTWLLDYLCRSGYQIISWILVIIPIVMVLLMLTIFANITKSMSKEERNDLMDEMKKQN